MSSCLELVAYRVKGRNIDNRVTVFICGLFHFDWAHLLSPGQVTSPHKAFGPVSKAN